MSKSLKKTINCCFFSSSTESKIVESTNCCLLLLTKQSIVKATKTTNCRLLLLTKQSIVEKTKSNIVVNQQIVIFSHSKLTFDLKLKFSNFCNICFCNKNELIYFIFELINFEQLCISKFIKIKIFR